MAIRPRVPAQAMERPEAMLDQLDRVERRGAVVVLEPVDPLGFPAVVKSDFIAAWDAGKCQQCRTCLQRCHFGAIHEEGGKVAFEPRACVGCGLCTIKCPSGALVLKQRC